MITKCYLYFRLRLVLWFGNLNICLFLETSIRAIFLPPLAAGPGGDTEGASGSGTGAGGFKGPEPLAVWLNDIYIAD